MHVIEMGVAHTQVTFWVETMLFFVVEDRKKRGLGA